MGEHNEHKHHHGGVRHTGEHSHRHPECDEGHSEHDHHRHADIEIADHH